MKTFGIDIAEGSDITNLVVASGTSDPATNPDEGELFYRTDTKKLRVYDGTSWSDVEGAGGGGGGGGATGGGSDEIFFENEQNVTANYTIPATKNAMSVGPVTIDNGVTVTVAEGAVWKII